jgi:hypothetical protein
MLAALANQEYQDAAKHYQAMPAGKERDDALKTTQGMLDQVIDAYAHAVALDGRELSARQVSNSTSVTWRPTTSIGMARPKACSNLSISTRRPNPNL